MPTTPRIYPKQTHATLGHALPNIVRWLVNDHPTYTGPGWTIVEVFSSSSLSRETPPSPTNLDSLTGAVSWASGSLTVNDWIVLESADANNSNHFQLYMRLVSTTVAHMLLIPMENFVTGGAVVSPPTLPTSSLGVSGSASVIMTGFSTPALYSAVADEGMAFILFDDISDANAQACYVGELDGARSNGTPADDRAYVIYDTPSTVQWANSATAPWNRLSPLDDSTILSGSTSGGETCHMVSPSALADINLAIHASTTRDCLLGVDSIMPIGIYYAGTHRHFAGFLRNVFSVHYLMGTAGTLDGGNFAFRNNDISQGAPGMCFRWDGSTSYP